MRRRHERYILHRDFRYGPKRLEDDYLMFAFSRLTVSELPMLHDWLSRPHVAERWDGPVFLRDMEKKFGEHMSSDWVFGYVAALGGERSAYIQAYDAARVGDGWWPDMGAGTWGIDQFLANEADLGKGLGTILVREFTRHVFDSHHATSIITDPSPDNARAIRCYEKAGFVALGMAETPDGPALLMRMNRPRP